MKRALLLCTVVLVSMVPARGVAQLSLEASVTSMHDDNIENNALRIEDRITETSLQAGYTWETEESNTQLFYMGAFNYFSRDVQRSHQNHAAGATHTVFLGDSLADRINVGATYALRAGREAFSYLDHQQLSLYANMRHVFGDDIAGKAGYTFRSLRFSELGEFNYSEHAGFLQTTFSLFPRTTMILETDLGVKVYATPNSDSMSVSRMMRRRGGVREAESTPSVAQLTGIARVGQSIAEGTGLSLDVRYQLNLLKETRYIRSSYGNIPDDEIFDDHYGYEGAQVGLMLTQLLPGAMTARIVAGFQRRLYGNLPAYDLAGNPVARERMDTRRSAALQWEKDFEELGLTAGIAYDYIVNESNDPYYEYHNSALTLQLQFSF